MRWWGKRYGEYKLIKGDFLDKNHTEKVNSANIIFVNNFAFGPNVDHQLKGILSARYNRCFKILIYTFLKNALRISEMVHV